MQQYSLRFSINSVATKCMPLKKWMCAVPYDMTMTTTRTTLNWRKVLDWGGISLFVRKFFLEYVFQRVSTDIPFCDFFAETAFNVTIRVDAFLILFVQCCFFTKQNAGKIMSRKCDQSCSEGIVRNRSFWKGWLPSVFTFVWFSLHDLYVFFFCYYFNCLKLEFFLTVFRIFQWFFCYNSCFFMKLISVKMNLKFSIKCLCGINWVTNILHYVGTLQVFIKVRWGETLICWYLSWWIVKYGTS